MRLKKFKRGHITSSEIIKWIIYLAILVAAGFGIKNMMGRFGG
jgi:hypothetical protein